MGEGDGGVMEEPITEGWLSASGFKWHQHERQPTKHWVLRLGSAVEGGMFSCPEDLGLEVAGAWWFNRAGGRVSAVEGDPWNVWITGQGRGFIHVRHFRAVAELVRLIEALTGLPWNAEDSLYGALHTPDRAARLRADDAAATLRAQAPPYQTDQGR